MESLEAKNAIDDAYLHAFEVERCLYRLCLKTAELRFEPRLSLANQIEFYRHQCDSLAASIRALDDLVERWREPFFLLSELLQFSYPAIGDSFDGAGRYVFASIAKKIPELRSWFPSVSVAFDVLEKDNNDASRAEVLKALNLSPLTFDYANEIRRRLYLEKGQLYRDHVPTELLALTKRSDDPDLEPRFLWRNKSVSTSSLEAAVSPLFKRTKLKRILKDNGVERTDLGGRAGIVWNLGQSFDVICQELTTMDAAQGDKERILTKLPELE